MIPVVINNFNRISTTQALCRDLKYCGYTDIHILDQGSDYEPLMKWYKVAEKIFDIKVVYQSNLGPQALYSGYMEKFKSHDWVAYTDSDIALNPHTPYLFIDRMVVIAEAFDYRKIGLALKIDDLPSNSYAQFYKNWEEQFWQNKILADSDVYIADVDTTFCCIKPSDPFQYKALRIGGNFTARHVPWYTDFDNLTKEEEQYLDKAKEDSTYKRYYREYIKK